MADEKEVNVGITSRFDSTGTDAAAEGMRKTAAAAKDLKEKASEAAEEGVKKLTEALAEMASLAEIVSLIRESTEEFYKQEKAMRAVNQAVSQLQHAEHGAAAEAKEWAEQMGLMSGTSIPEVTSALGMQAIRTGDLADAQHRVALAMDIGTATGKGFQYGMEMVNAAVLGQARQLKDLIPGIKGITDAHEASSKAMAYLEKNFYGATERVNDNAKAAEQAKVRWEIFKEQLGSQVAPAITWVREALMKTKDAVVLLTEQFGAWIIATSGRVAAFAGFLKDVFTSRKGLAGAWQEFRAKSHSIDVDYHNTLEALEEQALREQERREERGVEARKKANAGKLKSDIATAKEETLVVTDTSAIQDRFWQQEYRRRYIVNQQFIASEMKAEVDAEQAKNFQILMKEAELRKKIEENVKHLLAAKKQAARQEVEMQVSVANAAVGLATDLFGASKETAIAQAIINTYEGATKALAQGGIYGAVLAAIVVAAGLAQIAKIESSEPASANISTKGAGFDDPANDRAAYMTGRKWAADMVSNISSGWSDGLAAARTASSQTTNNNTYNVNQSRSVSINASIQDPSNVEAAKKLLRTLKMVDSNYLGQTTVAARTR